ncbi:MAG: succinyl-diaminopimelate desuccinylase [Polyangiaceae bacterium]|nr:succinyl-diaminopimelate desuccinylase [Polyangiaceae bacterium]
MTSLPPPTLPTPTRGTTLVDTLLWLCSIPSPTGEEGPLCDAIAARLAGYSLRVPPRRHLNSLLVPVSAGTGGPRVVLAGHLDVVRTAHDGPPRLEGDKLYGPGAADMKSGLSLMLALLEAPEAYAGCDLTLVFYSREEGPYADNELGPLLEREPDLRWQDLAICLEPSDNRLQLGCNGSLHARATFRGRTAHSARPWQGENAIQKAAPLLARLGALAPIEYRDGDLSYVSVTSATLAGGGRGRNVIPDEFWLNLNHRFTPGTTPEAACNYVRGLVGGEAELEFTDVSPSAPTFARHPLVERLAASGVAAVEPKQAWTDVARFASLGVPAVNFGPGTNAQAHQQNEWTHVPLLEASLGVLRRFLGSLGPADRPTPVPGP